MECSLYYKALYIKGGQSQNLEAYTTVAASSKSFSVQNDLEILAAIAGAAHPVEFGVSLRSPPTFISSIDCPKVAQLRGEI